MSLFPSGPAMSVPPSKYLVCVSDTPQSRVALKFACLKAQRGGGLVDILHVIPPPDFQTLFNVADRMQQERYEEAKTLLQDVCDEAYNLCGIRPSLLIREGQVGENILQAVHEDPSLDMLVLGASESGKSNDALISWLAAQLGEKLPIPLLLVPGNLTDQQILASI